MTEAAEDGWTSTETRAQLWDHRDQQIVRAMEKAINQNMKTFRLAMVVLERDKMSLLWFLCTPRPKTRVSMQEFLKGLQSHLMIPSTVAKSMVGMTRPRRIKGDKHAHQCTNEFFSAGRRLETPSRCS